MGKRNEDNIWLEEHQENKTERGESLATSHFQLLETVAHLRRRDKRDERRNNCVSFAVDDLWSSGPVDRQ